jgi:hypothetical protein
MENGRCRIHGGKTPKGIASPHFKTGRYSKAMPTALIESYDRARTDKEALNFIDDIALIDAMVLANLPKLETRESGKAWIAIKKSITELRKSFADEDYGRCLVTVDEMVDIINEQVLHYATEDELRTSLEQRRKLVESEQKRRVAMEQMVDSQDAMTIVTAMLQSVKENVSDPNQLTAIQSTFTRLTLGLRQRQLSDTSDGQEP